MRHGILPHPVHHGRRLPAGSPVHRSRPLRVPTHLGRLLQPVAALQGRVEMRSEILPDAVFDDRRLSKDGSRVRGRCLLWRDGEPTGRGNRWTDLTYPWSDLGADTGGTGEPGTGSWEWGSGLVHRPRVPFGNFPIHRTTRPIHPSDCLLSGSLPHSFHPSRFPAPGSPVDFGHSSRRVAQNGICTHLTCVGPCVLPMTQGPPVHHSVFAFRVLSS
jgi:hypothetical protein